MKIKVDSQQYTWKDVPDGIYSLKRMDEFYSPARRIAIVQTANRSTKDGKQKRAVQIHEICENKSVTPSVLWPINHPEDWLYIPIKGKWTIEIES